MYFGRGLKCESLTKKERPFSTSPGKVTTPVQHAQSIVSEHSHMGWISAQVEHVSDKYIVRSLKLPSRQKATTNGYRDTSRVSSRQA